MFVSVPSGASSGLITVTTEGKTSNGLPFLVTPGQYAGSCPAQLPQNQLQITTSSLDDGMVGQTYNASLSATGGMQAYTWSIANGSLPAGLALNSSSGIISGTPTTTANRTDLTVQVTDSSSPHQTTTAVFSLTVTSSNVPSVIYSYTIPSYAPGNQPTGYDAVGNIAGYTDSVTGTWSLGYDTLNRVTAGSAPSTSLPCSYAGLQASWTYDTFGNRTAESFGATLASCATAPIPASTSVIPAANNQTQTEYVGTTAYTPGYDAAGDVKSDPSQGNQYLYDAEGRVCAVQSTPVAGFSSMTGYLYDAEGRRVAKGTITSMSCDPATSGFQLTESYVLDQGGEELTMLNGNGTSQRTNVFGAGRQLATFDLIPDPTNTSPNQVPALHFQVTDPLGTRRMQVSFAGQPETDIQSLPFGDLLSAFPDQYAPATADDATPLQFTGKERDSESGNDYFGARYYGSSMGRFLSPDWSAAPMPVPFAKLNNPQTLNLYQYVGNNPLNGIDPDGHMCVMHFDYDEHGNQNGGTMSCDTSAESDCVQRGANCNKAQIGAVPGYSQAGKYAWRTANDALIIQDVDIFNDAHGYSSGDSGYLTPELVKAWMMEESGGTQSAFLRDPMQVNNPGDWADLKSEMGLTKGEEMTREVSVAAALGWLEYKGTPGRMDKFGEYTYTGSFRGDRNALKNYNGNTNIYPQDGGVQHRYVYSNTILNNAAQMSQ